MHLPHRPLLALIAVITIVAAGCQAAPPPTWYRDSSNGVVGHDRGWFEGGKTWYGDFGDPHVVRVGSTYYAYSSPTGGRYLPVLTSTDLVNWTIHRNWSTAGPPGRPGYAVSGDTIIPSEIRASLDTEWGRYNNNDGLVRPASWGLPEQRGPWISRALWAPGVTQIGKTWFAYSAVKVSNSSDDPHGFGRFCLTVASSISPIGPFRDISGAGPIQCQPAWHDPAGSIDPSPFHDPLTGRDYLLWKAAGQIGVRESALMSVELSADGRPKPGAPWVTLLQTSRAAPWEGGTVESPSMVRYGNTSYLFYSANYSGVLDAYGHSNYATGYAICSNGPSGGCRRPASGQPLLTSGPSEEGPGGASAFTDTAGGLRLAYSFFWPGERRAEFPDEQRQHPRRLRTVGVQSNPDGSLRLVR